MLAISNNKSQKDIMYVKIWHTLLYYLIFSITNCFASSVDFDGNVNFLLTAPQQVYLSPKPALGVDGYVWVRPQQNFISHFFGKTTTALNFKIESNYNTNHQNLSPILDEAFFSIKNDFGKLEFGNFLAVNQQLKQNPAKIARGAGGINGKYLEHLNLPMPKNNHDPYLKIPNFILLSQSPIGHGGEGRSFLQTKQRGLKDNSFDGLEDASKISYFLPKYQNHQLAVSYTFNTQKNFFTQNANQNFNLLPIKQIISLAWLYEQDFENLNLKLSATTEQGKISNKQQKIALHNLNSYDFGAIVSYFGIKIATSYGFWGKSLQAKNSIYACNYQANLLFAQQTCQSAKKFGNAYYYSHGLAYTFGPIGASLTNFNSNLQNNRYTATSFGLDYKIKKNLLSYIEFTNFSFKINQPKANNIANQSNINNKGLIMLTGIYFNF